MKYSLLLLLFLSANFFSIAGSERIVNYASPKTVYDIIFERQYAWVGTSGGLFRVDLSNGKQWVKISDESFPDPTVRTLAIDSKGRVWAGSKDGYLLRIDQNGAEYLNRSYVSAQWKIYDMIAYGPFLIIGSDKGVSLFDTRKNIVVKNSSRIGSFTSSQVNVLSIYNNRLYIGCERGFAVLDSTVDKIEGVNFHDPSIWQIDSSLDTSVVAIVKDSTGVRAFLTPAGYSNGCLVTADSNSVTLHLKDQDVTTYLPSNVTCLSILNGNQMWIGTQNDFYYFWGDGLFIPFVLSGPSFTGVSRITVDNNGALWAMPFGEANYPVVGERCPWWIGINRFDGYQWKNYGPKEYPQMGHMGFQPEALGLLKDRSGNLWFGFSGGGIKRYNPVIDDWYHYCNYGQYYNDGAFLRTQGACPFIDWGKCDAFAQDSNGYIWISSWNNYSGSLICYKPDTDFHDSLVGVYDSLKGQFKRLPPDGYGEAGVEISALAADASGNILYGTVKGLVSVFKYTGNPLTTGTIQTVKEFSNLPKILHINVVPDGSSLVLTAGGVYRFDPGDLSLTFQEDFDKNITSLSLESENIYWYGTVTNGLVRYDLKNNEKTYYNQAAGFVSNKVNDVVVDNRNGKVWIASDYGVSQLVLGYNISASGKGAEIVFPNPFSLRRHTVMHFQNLPADGTLRIYTLNGTLAGKPDVVRSGDNGAYYSWTPSRSCAPGTYFYSFVSSGVKTSGKIMIVP